MRRFYVISASLLLLAGLIVGCGKRDAQNDDDKKAPKPIVKVEPTPKEKDKTLTPVGKADMEKREKYQIALSDAIRALANRQWDDAMTAFKEAQALDNTEFVKSEITRLQQQMDQDATAKATVKNIESVLSDGNADEAVKLATLALKEFGGGDDAAKLILLRLQADALRNAQKPEADEAKFTRYKGEAEVSLKENNLRAAVLAMELALQAKNDAGLKEKYDVCVKDLAKYDALRKHAAELRRDPLHIEDALSALEEAAQAWDTPQVRAEIDECGLAREKRRDTVSVVSFDVRNDVGMADAGAALADELLPKLKPKFDLVERAQVSKVIGELKLERGFADDPKQQRQLGTLAKVRYLVFGSVARKVGVTVRARLVDVRTGLVVQTAKLEAPNMAAALIDMPKLAKQLMSDEFDAPAPQVAQAPALAPDQGDLLPAPQGDEPAPKLELNLDAPPPAFGNMKRQAFKVLAPPPGDGALPPQENWQDKKRKRLLFATVEIGDFLFRAGRFGEAQRQFAFALQLDPDNVQIQLRLQNVQPLAPPVVIDPQPFFVVKPGLAVLPFVVEGDPGVVPPSLSYWTPANLAPYFSTRFDIVDPNEIFWYMGRMGLSMQDLLVDPNARRWLGRAVGVRYFVFGACYDTGSFNVNTYLLDVETGYLQSQAGINVRDPQELRLRLPELAALTMMTPAEQAAYLAQLAQERYVNAVANGRRQMDEGRYEKALREFDIALSINPNDILVQTWFFYCQERARFLDYEQARRKRFEAQQAATAPDRDRRARLANDAEDARRRAIADAADRTPAQRQEHAGYRFKARDQMIKQAQIALKTDQFGISASLYQGAIDVAAVTTPGVVAPTPLAPQVYQDFASASREADRAAKRGEEAALRKLRDDQLAKATDDLAKAKHQIKTERAAADTKLQAVRADQLARDKKAYDDGVDQGQKKMTEKNYPAALAAFHGAQRVANGPTQNDTISGYIAQIVERQALDAGKTKADLAAERARRKAAEAKVKLNEDLYKSALEDARQALTDKNLDTAQARFKDAGTIFDTDAVKSGLQQVKAARAAQSAAQAKQADDERNRLQVKDWIQQGKLLLDAKAYEKARDVFQQANKLDPANLDVLAGLAQAKAGAPRPKVDPADPNPKSKQLDLDFQAALGAGQNAVKLKNYDAAVKAFQQALDLKPKDAAAQIALQEAKLAQGFAAKEANYLKALGAGQQALKAKDFDVAIKSFQQALDLNPKDQTALQLLQQAQDAKSAAFTANASFQKAIDAGQSSMKLKKYAEAIKSFTEATKLDPNDAGARKLLQQAQQALADDNQRALILANYDKAMTTGDTAMTAKRYKDAVMAYKDALKLIPNEKTATAQLKAAQQALADSTPTKTDPAKQFTEAVQRGALAAKEKKYADAVKAFQEALKLRPKDFNALNGWRQNQYALHLEEGQQYLDNAMWLNAQTEFEAAHKLFPNSDQAKKLLEKAKKKMK